MPAASFVFTVRECVPLDKGDEVNVHVPPAPEVVEPSSVTPSVSYSVTFEAASAVPLMVGVASFVMPSELETPVSLDGLSTALGAAGAVRSMVKLCPDVYTVFMGFPARSTMPVPEELRSIVKLPSPVMGPTDTV